MQYFQLQAKNFNETPKCWLLILAGCKYICSPAKLYLQPCQTYVWPAKWVIIYISIEQKIKMKITTDQHNSSYK